MIYFATKLAELEKEVENPSAKNSQYEANFCYAENIGKIQQLKECEEEVKKAIKKIKNKIKKSTFSYPTPTEKELAFYHRLQEISIELFEKELGISGEK